MHALRIALREPPYMRCVTNAFDGIPLHYSVYGAGEPTLFLIHGWSCNQDFWRNQVRSLTPDYRVVAVDLAAHGLSHPATARREWSMQSFARDIETIADALRIERFALAGHSMGGAVAVETALRVGERCRMLLGVDTFTDRAFYRKLTVGDISERMRPFQPDFARAIGAMIERITAPEIDPMLSAWIAKSMAKTDARQALPALEALLDWDIESRWPLVRCAVETINSGALAHPDDDLQLERLRVHHISGVGHFPMLEAPDTFNALATRILANGLLTKRS